MKIKVFQKIHQFVRGRRGIRFLKNLHKEHQDEMILVTPERGIGDLCILLAYLPEYIRSSKKKVRIVLPDNSHTFDLVKQFGIDTNQLVLLDKEGLKDMSAVFLSKAARSSFEKLRIKDWFIAACPHTHTSPAVNRIPSFSFLELFKYGIYQLGEDAPIHYPVVEKPDNPTKLLEPYVILNPYSVTCTVPSTRFAEIAKKLKGRGYNVYTNLGPGQKEIEGTLPLNVPIEELYHLAKGAECIITVRSGIADYIVSNSRKIITFYHFSVNAYQLKAWKTDCEIHEHLYTDDIDIDKIIEEATSHGN